MFRTIRLVHAWAGLILCLLLTVLSLSGSLLVLKDDYLRAVFPEARLAADLRPAVVGAAVNAIENEFGAEQLAYVSLARKNMSLHRIVFRDGRAAYARQNGEVVETWNKNGRAEEWIFHLHHYLFLGEFGKYAAGVTAISAVVMAATGIYLVLPFLQAFSGRLWPRSFRRRDLLSHHRDLGIIFSVPIILITLTGAAMVFYRPAGAILSFVTMSTPVAFERPAGNPGDINWEEALASAGHEFPGGQFRIVSWPRTDTATASIRIRLPGEWHQNGRTYAYIDPQTNAVIASRNGHELSRGERATNAIYPLHSMGIGGRFYDVIGVFTGIALTLLGLLASWSYLNFLLGRKRRKRTRAVQHS
ncbi:MAG: PepSY domain-containing protein [Pseudomonadota bacterium]